MATCSYVLNIFVLPRAPSTCLAHGGFPVKGELMIRLRINMQFCTWSAGANDKVITQWLNTVNIIMYVFHFFFKFVVFYFYSISTYIQVFIRSCFKLLFRHKVYIIDKWNKRPNRPVHWKMTWILQDLGTLGHIIFWKSFPFLVPIWSWRMAYEPKQVRVWRTCRGWNGPEPTLMGICYVPVGSQLALEAGAKPQLHTREAVELRKWALTHTAWVQILDPPLTTWSWDS